MLKISNTIQIWGLNQTQKSSIKNGLTLKNPNFARFKKMGIYAQEYFKYWKEENNQLVIPRGCWERLVKFYNSNFLPLEFQSEFVKQEIKNMVWRPNFELRSAQKEALDKIDYLTWHGIFEMGTGTGKTLLALEIIRKINLSALILVPNLTILKQFKNEAKRFYEIEIGEFSGEKKEIKEITVATFQSMNAQAINILKEKTSILIIDEAQISVAPERQKIIMSFNPSYIFGFTGTCEREDGKSKAINFLLGDILYRFSETPLIPKIKTIYWNKTEEIEIKDTKKDYPKIIDRMINCEERNLMLAELLSDCVNKGQKTLLLTKRIEHYENIKKSLKKIRNFNDRIYFISSKNKERNELLKEFKNETKHFDAIVGTTSLLSVGLDIPALDTLIIACDMRSGILTRQSAGRILRLFGEKKEAEILDIKDGWNGILSAQYYKRYKTYKKMGWICKN